MKVSLNLAVPQSSRERYAFAWSAVSLLALAWLIALCVSAGRNFGEYRRFHREILDLDAQERSLAGAELELRKDLERPELRSLFRETQFINTLIDRKRLSATTLTERITKLLPPSVRLMSLSVTQPDRERVARFVIAASTEEAVENFLIGLEDSSDFKDVAIVDSGIDEEGSAAGQVVVTCTARYVG